jgi:diguanylate cyclase (GGDEF)-like protein
MKTFAAFLRAFGSPYTYDPRRNSYLWLGGFWGLLIPLFTSLLDGGIFSAGVTGPAESFRAHPAHLVLWIQPLVLGVLFGAMGSVRRDLDLENERLIVSLQELAMTDALTGLHNRRFLKEALRLMLETSRRARSPLFLLIIDLDGFKAVNDEQGHVAGDRVLCDAARALKASVRQSEVLVRHGGDEFVLVGPGDRNAGRLLAERAAAAVRAHTGLGLSAGIASWPEDADTPDDLVAAADRALGLSKRKSHEGRTLPRIRLPDDVPSP